MVDSFREAIVAALGYAPADDIEPGKLHRFSTNGKRGDRSGWCTLFPDGRAGVFGCWRLGVTETWTAIPRDRMTPSERDELKRQIAASKAQREAEQQRAWRVNSDRVRYWLRQCRPVVDGDPVHRYLCSRMALPAIVVPECISIHHAMPYVHDGESIGTWPAMVAPMVNRKGELLALHRTYLDTSGKKADVPGPVRKQTPAAGLLRGAAIPLYSHDAGKLGVAEGIETAMAAYLASGVPTVAAYSAGALESFVWPAGVEHLVIFADHDDAGTKAAAGLRARAQSNGLSVSVMTPTEPGTDWCDVWAARGVEVHA